ncbi:MAG: hypothetical protein K1X63_04205 [Chitinophagales bacterium]|nr:hypothetical protein [Chitinophagales bacterium]
MTRTITIFLFLILLHATVAQAQMKSRAVSIADSVIMVVGGKENWDNTQYLQWTFFGRRTLWWNKWTGDVRIEIPSKKLLLLSNINSKTGKAFRHGIEITQADSVTYFNDRAYKILMNDSYWLAMPFKLRDPGVTLSYLGTAKDSVNNDCYLLQLTFTSVGVTPENKYHIWVDRSTYLVTQWAYFEKFSDDTAAIINPWFDYERYSNILLSGNRGRYEGTLTNISTAAIPDEFFRKP